MCFFFVLTSYKQDTKDQAVPYSNISPFCSSSLWLSLFLSFVYVFVGFCVCVCVCMWGGTGSAVEMRYALVSYGIAANSLPLDSDGHLIDDEFQKQARQRRQSEARRKEQIAKSDTIICPTNLDVLMGRGKPYQDYPGNVRFHQIIELHRPAYEATSRTRKSATIMEIVRTINAMGGRFLKKPTTSSSPSSSSSSDSTMTSTTTATSGTLSSSSSPQSPPAMASPWVEVDFNTAHKKVKDYFNYKGRNSSSSLSSSVRGNGNGNGNGNNKNKKGGSGVSAAGGAGGVVVDNNVILPSSLLLEEPGPMNDEMMMDATTTTTAF